MSARAKFSTITTLSKETLQALTKEHFINMTEIQEAAIPLALQGKDILGAAKTGSGKSLAFLIPVLEILHAEKWTKLDGLGALVITPTRELALQLFDVLRNIGFKHGFSAGLVIGGKDFTEEQEKIGRMNILIATPGRLLQHLDQTPQFQVDNLKILVLDEADKILELGFARTMNAILDALPHSRQTLLFSATQTRSVKDLARLSLKNPTFIQVHDTERNISEFNAQMNSKSDPVSMPSGLSQYYMICPLDKKLDWVYSFVRTHYKCKILVFLTSCKQVRFFEELFCKFQPGLPVVSLHGKQKQLKRMALFKDFCKKTAAVMFCTDLAARGLDFPKIDWVIQLDCPDTLETYIHRAGRTARHDNTGHSLLFLCPSEESGMLSLLKSRGINIEALEPNISKLTNIQTRASAICSQYPEIKYLGQKAVQCYMRSIFLNPLKTIFDVHAYPIDAFCQSIGLPTVPVMQFHRKTTDKKNECRAIDLQDSEEEKETKKDKKKPLAKPVASKVAFSDPQASEKDDHSLPKKSTNKKSESDEDDDEEFLQVKSIGAHENLDDTPIEPKKMNKKKLKKHLMKGLISNEHFLYDEEGVPRRAYEFETEEKLLENLKQNIHDDARKSKVKEKSQHIILEKATEHLEKLKRELKVQDQFDKERMKRLKLEKKYSKKNKNKANVEDGVVDDDSHESHSLQDDEARALELL